jgi:hypothetical protein
MDFGRHLHNGAGTPINGATPDANTGMTLGGQLAFLQVNGAQPASVTPTADLISLDHTTVAVSQTNVYTPAQLTVTVGGIGQAGATIAGGQYTIDNIPALDVNGVPTPPAAGSVSASFTGTAPFVIPSSTLATLTNGDHIIWVRVHDSANHWADPPSGVVFTMDRITGGANPNGGPIVSNVSLNPSVTNGSTPNSLPGQIGRTDTAMVTAGSATVTDGLITAADAGQIVTGVGIPAGAVVGNVTPGLSFDILVGGVATPATSNSNTVNIGVPGVPAVSADMVIAGTATPALPDWAITSFTWWVDQGGAQTVVSFPAFGTPGAPALGASVEITTAIPQSLLAGLSGDMTHTVFVEATEVQGTNNVTRTGNPISINFTKTATGPTATIESVTPSPAGPASDFLGNANYFPSVRIRGTFNDTLAQVAGGEMWLLPIVGGNVVGADASGRPGADGTGTAVSPDSGLWTAPAGSAVPFLVDVPSAEFNALPQGPVKIFIHGRDAAGQWNQTMTTVDLHIDKTPPEVLDATSTPSAPNPVVTHTPNTSHYTLTFSAHDPATVPPPCTVNGTQITPAGCGVAETSKVTAIEWMISDPNGIDIPGLNDFTVLLPNPSDGPASFSVDISGGPQTNGVYPAGDQVQFRIRDGAGNWNNWRLVNIP